jgi:hypothetical protein
MSNRDKFLYVLKRLEGKASNATLFGVLSKDEQWTAEYYTAVKEALKDEGLIKIGRGRGGTVMLTDGINGH